MGGFPDATETGVLSFRNTLQQAPPFSSPCCSAVYIEDAMLEVGQQSLNFSSPGTSGTCGPSPPGWFIFANLSWVSGTCYVGDLTVFNPVAGCFCAGCPSSCANCTPGVTPTTGSGTMTT